MKTFNVKIELGNATMQNPEDVAYALRRIARILFSESLFNKDQTILDVNGNIVGSYGTKGK